ncbi:MAG TPA: EAL domain-containing protein [Pseudonocardiaceae bacterium]|nr:EAL domain-containing protein [Pseudonocardiaceae bacterium]
MSTATRPAVPAPRTRGARPDARIRLARAWWAAISTTNSVPMSDGQVEDFLAGLLDRLIDVLGQHPYHPQAAAQVGVQLVAKGFTGRQGLARSMKVLTQELPGQPELRTVEDLTGKVTVLLGELAAGYAQALRRRMLDQQEDLKRAIALRENEERFREAFGATAVGIAISTLDGTITETNGALAAILGYSPGELTGRELHELVHPEHTTTLATAYHLLAAGLRTRFQTRSKLVAPDGEATWVSLSVSVLSDADGVPTHHVTMVQDVNDGHLVEQQLRHQTLHDLLTGLPNQEYFWIRLKAVLERARPETIITLCKIDVDGFAVINDSLGYDIGNRLLQSVATRLVDLVAKDVTEDDVMVARFGVDEFAILIENSPGTPDVATLAANINAELAEPIYLGDHGLAVSAGIGLVQGPASDFTAEQLVRAADNTMHRAKRTGRGQWGLHDPPTEAEDRARFMVAAAMPAAWENGQVTLCYQPLIRLNPAASDAGRVVALQALLSWEHPEHGSIGHEQCLALAEQTGLILSLGPWMLAQSCDVFRGRRTSAGPPVRIDLTTHLAQDPDLVAVLRDALDSASLQPQDVQLGIPVDLVACGHSETRDNLDVLADNGTGIVLTGFGAAAEHLAAVEDLPVQAVDIGHSVLRRIAQQPDSMVRDAMSALVPMLRRTGISVVVSGVDCAEQANWWRAIGADVARGEAFAPPVSPAQTRQLLRP